MLTSVCSSVWNDAAVAYVPACTVTVDRQAACRVAGVEVQAELNVARRTVSGHAARVARRRGCDSCPACAPKLPSSRFWLPNAVVLPIRSISSRSCAISFCAAVRAVESEDAVLADCDDQVVDALQHRVDLRRAHLLPFARPRCRPGRSGVASVETRNLLAQVLADDQTRRVVGGSVDAVTGRELLEAARTACRWCCSDCGRRRTP